MHVVVASHHRLPVEGYGGPQRVVVALVRGLAALGHRVTVLAQPGTRVSEAAKIVEVAPRVLKDPGARDLKRFIIESADIMHAHFPMKQAPKGSPLGPPLPAQAAARGGAPVRQAAPGHRHAAAPPPPNPVFPPPPPRAPPRQHALR